MRLVRRFVGREAPSAQPPPPRTLGRRAERAAGRMLRRAGYKVLARNVHVPRGEADLICLAPDRCMIVVVEVKSRRLHDGPVRRPARPEDNVHAMKRRKLVGITRSLIRRHGWQRRPVRIDVVTVDWLQWLLFSVIAIGSLLLFRGPLLARINDGSGTHAEVDSLIGEVAIALEELPAGATGKAELRGTTWTTKNVGATAFRKGQRGTVTKVDGLTLWMTAE